MTQQQIRTKRLELEKNGAEAQEELNKLQSSIFPKESFLDNRISFIKNRLK